MNDYSLGNSYTSHQTSLNIGPGHLVYNSELEGVTLAIKHASKIALPKQQIHIFSDNQAGLYWLQTTSDNLG